MVPDFAMECELWHILEYCQNVKVRISNCGKGNFFPLFTWLPVSCKVLIQLFELTYLHRLKRLFSLLASPGWLTHLRSNCWQRRCFWSCRWHCQHLNEIWCQGKHMKNLGNNIVNCMWILKNSDVSVDGRCVFFILKNSIFLTLPLPSVIALALKIS